MPSKSDNFFTRIKENVMGTKEENAQAEKDIAKYKESKAKEKMKEEEAKKKLAMAKGGLSSGKQSPAGAVKKATVKKSAGKTVKKPAIALMIAVGKPKMNKGGMSKKKC
jgi:hypothetical protein